MKWLEEYKGNTRNDDVRRNKLIKIKILTHTNIISEHMNVIKRVLLNKNL